MSRWSPKHGTAIVTGAGGGLGSAIAGAFAEHGVAVLVTDVDGEAANRTADRLAGVRGPVRAAELDVSDELAWRQTVEFAEATFSRPTVLVNNAAVFSYASIEEESREGWERVLAVNATGAFLGIKAVAPAMAAARRGSIVNIASAWALVAQPSDVAYHASKGALLALTRNAAVTYAAQGVRVNAVCPGLISTPALADGETGGVVDRVRDLTPMGRPAEPREIAAVVRLLASDDGSYMTGAIVTVDGGYTSI